MVRAEVVLLGGVLLVSACAQSPYNFPQPALTPDGERAYSMTGVIPYTREESVAEVEVRQILVDACGGPIEMIVLDMQRDDSWAGVPHMRYDAIAACK